MRASLIAIAIALAIAIAIAIEIAIAIAIAIAIEIAIAIAIAIAKLIYIAPLTLTTIVQTTAMLTGVSVMKKMGFQIAFKTRNVVSSSDHNWKIIPCSRTSDEKGPASKLSPHPWHIKGTGRG